LEKERREKRRSRMRAFIINIDYGVPPGLGSQ